MGKTPDMISGMKLEIIGIVNIVRVGDAETMMAEGEALISNSPSTVKNYEKLNFPISNEFFNELRKNQNPVFPKIKITVELLPDHQTT